MSSKSLQTVAEAAGFAMAPSEDFLIASQSDIERAAMGAQLDFETVTHEPAVLLPVVRREPLLTESFRAALMRSWVAGWWGGRATA